LSCLNHVSQNFTAVDWPVGGLEAGSNPWQTDDVRRTRHGEHFSDSHFLQALYSSSQMSDIQNRALLYIVAFPCIPKSQLQGSTTHTNTGHNPRPTESRGCPLKSPQSHFLKGAQPPWPSQSRFRGQQQQRLYASQ